TVAQAQNYPSKPVRLVLPYAPGGIIDYVGRTLAQKLSENLGQPVVAENRPGGGGVLGTDSVARSAPDGYTLVLMDPAIIINPTLQADVPYDVFRNLQTVSIISSSPEVLVISPILPVKTFPELVAYGKANPGKLNFASAGIGTTPHLAGEMFKLRTGIDATHIPYKGIGASYTDMIAGCRWRSPASPAPYRSPPTIGCARLPSLGRSAAVSIPTCRPSPRRALRGLKSTSGWACLRRPNY